MREQILAGRTLVSREKFRTKSLLKVHRNLWKEAKKTEEGKLETSRTRRAFKYRYPLYSVLSFTKKVIRFLKKNRVLLASVVVRNPCETSWFWNLESTPRSLHMRRRLTKRGLSILSLVRFHRGRKSSGGWNTNILNHLLGSSSGGIAFNSPYQFACIDPWK